jgi:alkylation response protein AidB-like acyl-CoA dehydrogenase
VVVVTEGNSALVASSDLLTTLRLEGLDSSLGWLMVGGDLGDDGLVRIAGWDEALRRARLAVASELLGLGRAMLDLARTHALERHQFGQPIARFQAVRHRLADALVALEAASSAIGAAWNDGLSLSAVMAKSVAGRSARIAAGHAQQVLAGIGFTSEHPFHLHLRRVLVLDQLFGGTGRSARSLGQLILESGKLPEFGGL